jgi:hypothetical protein
MDRFMLLLLALAVCARANREFADYMPNGNKCVVRAPLASDHGHGHAWARDSDGAPPLQPPAPLTPAARRSVPGCAGIGHSDCSSGGVNNFGNVSVRRPPRAAPPRSHATAL